MKAQVTLVWTYYSCLAWETSNKRQFLKHLKKKINMSSQTPVRRSYALIINIIVLHRAILVHSPEETPIDQILVQRHAPRSALQLNQFFGNRCFI